MDCTEALELFERELGSFREKSHAELAQRTAGGLLAYERSGPGGTTYQIEIHFVWDASPGADIRVMASIDDGGWRAFAPLTRSFHQARGRIVRRRVAAMRDSGSGIRDSRFGIHDPGFGIRDSRIRDSRFGIGDQGSGIRDSCASRSHTGGCPSAGTAARPTRRSC